jgi:TonB-dependent SusC/RagA subfamily outer membrane receptor
METRTRKSRFLPVFLGRFLIPLAFGCGATTSPPAVGPEPERVSVGYGTQAKEDLSGSVASLSARELEKVRAARVEELLRGRLAGVQVIRRPDGDFSVRIRGTGSFYGSSEPLYVVDGVPIHTTGLGSALAGISPRDIARIDVLKDAGATAIYGSRGANGVIVITTKRRN